MAICTAKISKYKVCDAVCHIPKCVSYDSMLFTEDNSIVDEQILLCF